MVEYTGEHMTIEIDDVAIGNAMVTFDFSRDIASHARSGKLSDLKLPGKLSVTGTLSRIMVDGELLGYVIGDTTVSGGAGTLHAGLTAPGAAGESVTDMTTTDSQSSRIKVTALTAAITAGGYIIIYGTDVNDSKLTEVVQITTLGVSEAITADKIFKTVTHVAAFDYVQAGGTLKVESVAGASSIVVGTAKYFKLEGILTSGSSNIHVTADNCFLTGGQFSATDANEIASDELPFAMKDEDADLTLDYVA